MRRTAAHTPSGTLRSTISSGGSWLFRSDSPARLLDSFLSLRTIRYCAIALVGFVAVGEVIILSNRSDDPAGGVFMGAVVIFASIVVATAMALLERALKNAVDMKSENDLTV